MRRLRGDGGQVRLNRGFTISAMSVGAISMLVLSCGDGGVEPAPPPPVPTTVTVSPGSASLTALGETARLAAEVRDQNGQVMAGASVAWTSSDASVAAVDAAGVVTAVANGSATVTATAGSASGTAAVTVAQMVSSVAVSPPSATLGALGDTLRLSAEALDAKGGAIADAVFTWTSGEPSVAAVDALGLVMAADNGTATITATTGSVPGTAAVTVQQVVGTVTVWPPADTIFRGDTLRITAQAVDGNGHVVDAALFIWSSSNPLIARVDRSGLVEGLREGTATVTAASGAAAGISELTVTSADREPLRAIYDAMDGPNWVNSTNWLSAMDLGTWHGVTTGDDGRVTHLELVDNFLDNAIPPEIGRLERLVRLDLSENLGIDGRMPQQLGDLANLEWLDLSGSYFHARGTIPAELGNLKKLKWLDLSDTWFWATEGGPIPAEFGNLESLERLDLRFASLRGRIPSQLGDLERLTWLDLSDNRLTGEIPRSFTKLELDLFHWDGNGNLCAPADQEFQEWLKGIENHNGGKTCDSSG